MYRCLPDRHQDEAVLRSALKTLRQQCKQIKSLTGITLPAVLSAEFSGPETPWIIVRGDKPMVCPFNDSPQAFIDWQQTDDNILALPTVSQAFSFIRNTLADELEKPDGLTPPVRVFSVIMRLGVVNPATRSVWAGWLYSRTCLQFPELPGSHRQVCSRMRFCHFWRRLPRKYRGPAYPSSGSADLAVRSDGVGHLRSQ